MLNARLDSFDLTALNELLVPLASAEVQSGWVREMAFSTEASSKGATVEMVFLYNGLKAALLKEKDGVLTDKKFLTGLVNRVLKQNNPDKTGKGFNKTASFECFNNKGSLSFHFQLFVADIKTTVD